MQRLTVAGRLLITALVLAGIYFAFRYFGGSDALKKLQPKDKEHTESQTLPRADDKTAEATVEESQASDSKSSDEASSDQPQKAFTYTAPEPQNGLLKGVV